jgi:hypothetical protein
MTQKYGELLREKMSHRAALIDRLEDMTIQMLALQGEVRYLDWEIEGLIETIKIQKLELANARRSKENAKKKKIHRLQSSRYC